MIQNLIQLIEMQTVPLKESLKNGKTVCSGYARLYKDIAVYLELKVECVNCYAKGYGYEPGQKFNSTNHEYNVIFLNNKWIGIDATWGAGHAEGTKYIKEYNEFYFLVDPELLIKTHFPEDPKWIVTKKNIHQKIFQNGHMFIQTSIHLDFINILLIMVQLN